MRIKQYKVKYDHGEIKPLEPIEIEEIQEGIVIFFESNEKNEEITPKKIASILSEDALKKVWENSEDDIYNDL